MLCCDTCGSEPRDIEDLAAFVAQLAALGVDARVHVLSVPDGLGRNVQFDLAPYLVDRELGVDDRIVLLAADRLGDERLVSLRRLAGPPARCVAFGTFATRQAVIGAQARLAYAFGTEPEICNLAGTPRDALGARGRGPVFGVPRRTEPEAVPRVLVVAPDLADRHEGSALVALSLSRRHRVAVLTDGPSKQNWQTARGTELPIFHYGEVLPEDLAGRVDICVSFVPPNGSYRLQCLVANLAAAGAALVDATHGHAIAAAGDAFLRGPNDIASLGQFLETEVMPNLEGIAHRTASSQTASRCRPEAVLPFLTQPEGSARPASPPLSELTFVPTNGIGLGHAQRCALVAQELDGIGAPVFAAFPSCMDLVKSHGFDVMPLIGRSALHQQTFENDLANYIRLRALTRGGRTLVFDGGYVFDSIFRTIIENRLAGVWIRRGLWQSGQANSVALDREKVFARVIVPREAFEELNVRYSHGPEVREVGPIVRRPVLAADARGQLREALAERYGMRFDRLVVSLLGGGVAAGRGAQTQALCGILERRPDTLHLVVVWPSGRQEPAWFGWDRTRVVATRHAGALVAAADLCVAAAGYNLFHEVLYGRAPTIFIPQTGPFMDDQRARARAAADRGLAALVEPAALMRLDRTIARFLDAGEAEAALRRLTAVDLPEPGNRDAAAHIAEVHDGNAGLLGDRRAHRSAGGG